MAVPPEIMAQMQQQSMQQPAPNGMPQQQQMQQPMQPPPPPVPVPRKARRNPNQMKEDEFQSVTSQAVEDAIDFCQTEIGPRRASAIEAYHGALYGDEQEGQSQYVSRDVHDTVMGQLPDIVRILLGPEQVCAFEAQTPADERWVGTATRYVDQVIQRQNDGFGVLYAAVKDALLVKKGFLKYWWDESVTSRTYSYSGLTGEEVLALQSDSTMELVESEPQPPDPGFPQPLYDVRFQREVKRRKVKISALPPEEFLVDRNATGLEPGQYTLLGHYDSTATVASLVALGYDRDMVLEHATSGDPLEDNPERVARTLNTTEGRTVLLDDGSRPVEYVEAWIVIDFDGDGIAELRRVCFMGPGREVVSNEPVDDHPFAALDCDPEPHAFFGESSADKVMDLQRLKTHITRNVMDSLAQAVHPRTAAVEGQVNMADLLNNEIGSVVRIRQIGALQDLSTPFTGGAAMPILGYLDSVREMRTGVSRQSLGLSGDTMQSTTKLAVEQSVSGSQGKIELIARVMANGLLRLYGGILKLLIENQDKEDWMTLGGTLVRIDPREWNAEVGVKVNVALGAGTTEQRAATLTGIIGKQEMILQQLGMDQPIVTPAQYGAALRKWVELTGWRNPQMFFSEVPPGWQPPPPPPPPPDPNQLAMQVQQAQIAAQVQVEQIKSSMQRDIAQLNDSRERDKNVSDAILKNRQMELQYKGAREANAVKAAQGLEQAGMQQETAREQMHHAAQQKEVDAFNDQIANMLNTPAPDAKPSTNDNPEGGQS